MKFAHNQKIRGGGFDPSKRIEFEQADASRPNTTDLSAISPAMVSDKKMIISFKPKVSPKLQP